MRPLAHFSTIYLFIWDLTAEKQRTNKKAPLKLKVIHLLRRLERIERDLEELDDMLSRLPMDREYSLRLRDSLIEESARLKEFKQKILTQRVAAEASSVPEESHKEQENSPAVSINIPGQNSNGSASPEKDSRTRSEPRKKERKPASQKPSQEKEKPAFEFRFE